MENLNLHSDINTIFTTQPTPKDKKLRELNQQVLELRAELAVRNASLSIDEIVKEVNRILKLNDMQPIRLKSKPKPTTKTEAMNRLNYIIWYLIRDSSEDKLPD